MTKVILEVSSCKSIMTSKSILVSWVSVIDLQGRGLGSAERQIVGKLKNCNLKMETGPQVRSVFL